MTVKQYKRLQRVFFVAAAVAAISSSVLAQTLAWIPGYTLVVAGTCGLALNAYAVFAPPK